ncbi:uncharacterized protein LOC114751977 [Neltuma alba]|uniref:uncharacterized protein LOC114751977 n=1 Tax=Neltuma alba TaxID=207710 RepID=UPI0010A49F98|nr:uncharacterized protein LOC114751977 [Prosopis alba]
MVKEIETLSEDERRALRGSKFAPLPSLSRTSSSQPRLAHPGGPVTTNKAAALAKFLERKLKEPDGLASINPDLLEVAVNDAKQTVFATSSTSNPERIVRHVDSFGNTDTEDSEGEKNELSQVKECKKRKSKKKKDKKRNKKRKKVEDPGLAVVKKHKKKFKF